MASTSAQLRAQITALKKQLAVYESVDADATVQTVHAALQKLMGDNEIRQKRLERLINEANPNPTQISTVGEDMGAAVAEAQSTGLTDEQVVQARDMFELYTHSVTGALDIANVTEVMFLMGQHMAADEISVLIDDFDENGDGQLGFPEFLVLYSRVLEEGSPPMVDLKAVSHYGVTALVRWVHHDGDEVAGDVRQIVFVRPTCGLPDVVPGGVGNWGARWLPATPGSSFCAQPTNRESVLHLYFVGGGQFWRADVRL
jgi:hypothetical protein